MEMTSEDDGTIQTWTSKDLACQLLKRHNDNAKETVTFLLSVLDHIPSVEEISATLMGNEEDNDVNEKTVLEMRQENGALFYKAISPDANATTPPGSKTKLLVSSNNSIVDMNPKDNPTLFIKLPSSNNNDKNTVPSSRMVEVSSITPRGKFNLSIHQTNKSMIMFSCSKQTETLSIPLGYVKHIVFFPKPEDCRGALKKMKGISGDKSYIVPGSMVLLHLHTASLKTVMKEKDEEEESSDSSDDDADEQVAKPILFRNKPLKHLCFQLPSVLTNDITSPIAQCKDREYEWVQTLSKLLDTTTNNNSDDEVDKNTTDSFVTRVPNPKYDGKFGSVSDSDSDTGSDRDDILKKKKEKQKKQRQERKRKSGRNSNNGKTNTDEYVFRSEDGTSMVGLQKSVSMNLGGMPFLRCYSGVNDGVLFPLESGLLFFKPPRFFHRNQLNSILAGRGSGGSRYIDLSTTVDTVDQNDRASTVEFTNIDRDELNGLNRYIHDVLIKAMGRDVAADDKGRDNGTKTRSLGRTTAKSSTSQGNKRRRAAVDMRENEDNNKDDDDDSNDDDSATSEEYCPGDECDDNESESDDDDSLSYES